MIFNDDHSAPLSAIDDCALQEGKKIVVILCFFTNDGCCWDLAGRSTAGLDRFLHLTLLLPLHHSWAHHTAWSTLVRLVRLSFNRIFRRLTVNTIIYLCKDGGPADDRSIS